MAWLGHRSLIPAFTKAGATMTAEAGQNLDHTSVTSTQMDALVRAVQASQQMSGPIIEIGSYRGVTTRNLALSAASGREVVAIDPYLGEGGHDHDLRYFEEHTANLANVRHIPATSDAAFAAWGGVPISMVFIDAIHEYLHAWYDFAAWGSMVVPGGFVAFHDVDKFHGVNRVIQKILRECPEWKPWAYAPNIAIFQRASPK